LFASLEFNGATGSPKGVTNHDVTPIHNQQRGRYGSSRRNCWGCQRSPCRTGRNAASTSPACIRSQPAAALDLLRQGNADFLNGRQTTVLTGSDRRLELAKGQNPFAAYVTCSDSRVPPELLFGRGLGELFIIRNAGNTVDTVALGSIEYAVAVLKVPLVVVMGHEAAAR